MHELIRLAGNYALTKNDPNDRRNFLIGAVGQRRDGAIVHSRNLSISDIKPPNIKFKRFPNSHAERRLIGKLDYGSVIYVARIARGTRDLAMARPCELCRAVIENHGVLKVYYSISPNEYGIWFPNSKKEDQYYYKRVA
jgi:hypothetical protein